MRKILPLIFLILLAVVLPLQANAQGLVSCTKDCGLCDIFVLIQNLINFFLVPGDINKGFALVPMIATALIIFGALQFMLAAGNPSRLESAKKILTAVIIGIIIIYGSWALLNTLFRAIEVNEWVGLRQGGWKVTCDGKTITPP